MYVTCDLQIVNENFELVSMSLTETLNAIRLCASDEHPLLRSAVGRVERDQLKYNKIRTKDKFVDQFNY